MEPLGRPTTPRWLKHVLDRVFAATGLVVLSPLFAAIVLAIVLEDLLTGEGFAVPFYREPRISAGRRFHMIKFRIFKPSALRRIQQQAGGSLQLLKPHEKGGGNASRTGRLLHKIYLDELPQLLNVLLGSMSFVGPRPVPLNDAARTRLFRECGIRGGLTGLYQLTKGTQRAMHESDIEYYREWCRRGPLSLLAFDLSIMVGTILKMVKAEGL